MIKENVRTIEEYVFDLINICEAQSYKLTGLEYKKFSDKFNAKWFLRLIKRPYLKVWRWWRNNHPDKSQLLTPLEAVAFCQTYQRAITHCKNYAKDGTENVQINFFPLREAGYQVILEGEVKDLGKPYDPSSFNFHGSNTSQWLFGFGLVFDTERRDFSIHT